MVIAERRTAGRRRATGYCGNSVVLRWRVWRGIAQLFWGATLLRRFNCYAVVCCIADAIRREQVPLNGRWQHRVRGRDVLVIMD